MIASFQSVAKWYGSVIGLVDVSVELQPGITGLLGPNGAGKSTFLKLLTGQLLPSTGTVRILGADPFRSAAVHRRVGYCPEPDALYEDLDARSFVLYLTRMHGFGLAEARRRADEAIERVGLTEAAGKKLRTFSKGMRQRIKLAQALAHDPEVLVLDEPLNGLDPLARRNMFRLLAELADAGKSVLVSSHILHEVQTMTKNILLLHQGRVLAQGTVDDIRALLDRYPHRIRIRSERARDLGRALFGLDAVLSVQLDAEQTTLEIETRTPDVVYDQLPALVLDEGIPVRALEAADASLDAVFEYLVG